MYSLPIAYLLWALGGFGALGLHRFYMGKFGTGVLYLFSGGLGMIGSVYDFFTLPGQIEEANIRLSYRKAMIQHGAEAYANHHYYKSESKDTLERKVLKLAKKNNGVVSPSELALSSDISIEKAQAQLDKLVSKGFAEIKVRKSGSLVYFFPDFMTDPIDGSDWEVL
ncbi:TM2 domain-containing protein [Spirochaeta cellobiosiphila]|uniref:TM2 domain-containing protein n=1 Tax=Spirochaeta cellobiosiphila TaxID=504483 RepID=UPI000404B5C6|nr:TM2 domain-containing protein [Spirochaeta cellobiosiphila]